MKKIFMTIMVLTLTALLAVATAAETKTKAADAPTSPTVRKAPKIALTFCPVCGSKVKKELSAYYDGYRVYFDNINCRQKFYVEPEKYYNEMKRKKIDMEKATRYIFKPQEICPFTGDPIDKKIKEYYDAAFVSPEGSISGGNIYFCKEKCLEQFQALNDAQKQSVIEKLKKLGFNIEQGISEK